MYAIVANGSKQYKAEVGAVIRFEKLTGNVGDKVDFNVLMLSDGKEIKVGKDVSAIKAHGEIVLQGKEDKIVVFKYKAKKNERKKQGHRQPFTAVKILAIDGEEAPAEKPAKKAAPKTAKPKTAKAETAEVKAEDKAE